MLSEIDSQKNHKNKGFFSCKNATIKKNHEIRVKKSFKKTSTMLINS